MHSICCDFNETLKNDSFISQSLRIVYAYGIGTLSHLWFSSKQPHVKSLSIYGKGVLSVSGKTTGQEEAHSLINVKDCQISIQWDVAEVWKYGKSVSSSAQQSLFLYLSAVPACEQRFQTTGMSNSKWLIYFGIWKGSFHKRKGYADTCWIIQIDNVSVSL